MPKYALFHGENYYPQGGAWDFACFGESVEDLKRKARTGTDRWAHIVSLQSMEVVLINASSTAHKWRVPEVERWPKKEQRAAKHRSVARTKQLRPISRPQTGVFDPKAISEDRKRAVAEAWRTCAAVHFNDPGKGPRIAHPNGLVEVALPVPPPETLTRARKR